MFKASKLIIKPTSEASNSSRSNYPKKGKALFLLGRRCHPFMEGIPTGDKTAPADRAVNP
ncbi:MAG: hypothetical protein LBJ92_04095 [Holosporales bacterium]|nr:hypothetical protein [Holosporales bacterium]